MSSEIKLESGWKNLLAAEFETPYFEKIRAFVRAEFQSGKAIYPPPAEVFAAFDLCPLEKLKIVILGQDPYHSPGAANGLAFSVNRSERVPPSLQNIFKEIENDPKIPDFKTPQNGDLRHWAEQGVLLLNSALTVPRGQPNGHCEIWKNFTDGVISRISGETEGIIFLLWGRSARSKKDLIDAQKHFILEASHPSPFSANSGFFGCGHFSRVNEILVECGKKTIDWNF